MNLSSIFPPSDLLQQVGGVERGLRRNQRLGTLGRLGVVVAVVQAMAVVIQSGFWDTLTSRDWHALLYGADGNPGLLDQWVFLLALAVLIASVFLIARKRYWLKESKAPFRYTFAVDDFMPVTSVEPYFVWMRHHLASRLKNRIGRLSLLESGPPQPPPAPADGSGPPQPPAAPAVGSVSEGRRGAPTPEYDSHVRVGGHYGIRQDTNDWWILEVTPRVRIGPPGSAETLAHDVTFRLNKAKEENGARVNPESLSPDDYEKLVERVYFSVATEIYMQISRDVQHKIDLLPTNYLKATADLHEAQDYSRSNTLVAYDEAQRLYAEAVSRFDPAARPWPSSWLRWPGQFLRRVAFWIGRRSRRLGAFGWKRLARRELILARANVGYVNVLLDRRGLAGMSGHRVNPIFEARPVAEKAVRGLGRIPRDVPGVRDAEFDARVALALAWAGLGSVRKARDELECARRLLPMQATEDSRFLYAEGSIASRPRSRQLRFQRATELDPGFEGAQFALAFEAEMAWRSRGELETDVATGVFDEYQRVLTMNPGNIAAWANLGYMRWLLADREDPAGGRMARRRRFADAQRAFERGHDYKTMKRETFVAEVDYGLARIAAEEGRFDKAYSAFTSALTAHMTQSISQGYYDSWSSSSDYYFARIGRSIMDRFERYRSRVQGLLSDAKYGAKVPARVRDSILAFVVNDYGEACYNYYLRSGELRYREWAMEAYAGSMTLDASYPIPCHNLYLLHKREGWLSDAEADAEALYRIEPDWFEAKLAMMWKRAQHAAAKQDEVDGIRRERLRLVLNAGKATRAVGRNEQQASSIEGPDVDGSRREQTYVRVRAAQASATEAGSYAREAADLDRRRQAAETEAGESRKRAEEILQELLPHDWLWHGRLRATTPERVILRQRRRLVRRLFNRRLRWEREFDDIHVKALYDWAWALLTPIRSGRTVSGHIFAHVEEHFWQDNFEILQHFRSRMESRLESVVEGTRVPLATLRTLAKSPVDWPNRGSEPSRFSRGVGRLIGVPPELVDLLRPYMRTRRWAGNAVLRYQRSINKYNDILGGTIMTWLDGEPDSYWSLWRLDDAHLTVASNSRFRLKARYTTMGPLDRARFLLRAVDDTRDAPALHGWVGEKLQNLSGQLSQRLVLAGQFRDLAGAVENGDDAGWERFLDQVELVDWEETDWGGVDWKLIQECRGALRSAKPDLLQSVAEQLERLGDGEGLDDGWVVRDRLRDAAVRAYELAMGSDDPDVLSRLPHRLKELDREDLCIQALRQYRDAAGPSDVAHLWSIAEGLKEAELWAEAREAFGEARRQDESNVANGGTRRHSRDRYQVEIARTLWREGLHNDALNELERVAGNRLTDEDLSEARPRDGWWTEPEAMWRTGFVRELLDAGEIRSTEDYHMVRVSLERSQCADGGGEFARRDAGEALLVLARERRARAGFPWARPDRFGDAPEMQPLVAPIVLEADDSLFDGGADASLDKKMVESDIPNMSAAIQSQTGVRIPGVRIRPIPDDLINRRYVVKLHEIPLAKGRAKDGRRDGMIAEGVEPIVRRYLDTFVGFQEVHGLVEQWRSTAPDGDIESAIADALPDGRARGRLVAVLQRLIREGVPIKDLQTIADAFKDASSLADTDEIVERVRRALPHSLPGNDQDRRDVTLDPDFEEALERWTHERDGKRFLIVPRDETAMIETFIDLLAAQLDDGSNTDPVIVVPDHLRRFVRRLVAPRFPFVPVVGEGERTAPRVRELAYAGTGAAVE